MIFEIVLAFSIALPVLFIILTTPSFVYMIKVGKKEYFKNWKTIFQIKKGLEDCLLVEEYQQYVYNYPNGSKRTYGQTIKKYYYPIYKENGDIYFGKKAEIPMKWLYDNNFLK